MRRCIGPKGTSVSKIVEELGGEKIDIAKRYNEKHIAQFISAALPCWKTGDVKVQVEIVISKRRRCVKVA